MLLSSGILVAGFLDVYNTLGYSVLWLLLPLTLLFMAGVKVNDMLIPLMLLKGRYVKYCSAVFIMVYSLSTLALCIEYVSRDALGLPMRIGDYSSPWILADLLGNSMLLFMILLGLGLLHIFKRWKNELETDNMLADKLETYINAVNDRLNSVHIMNRLRKIASHRYDTVADMEDDIRKLSGYLRKQLYELPQPPEFDYSRSTGNEYSRVTELLVSRRFHYLRHVVLCVVLLIISCGAFFNAPDNPEFTADRCMGVLSMFAILVSIAYLNVLWLYPRFMKRGSIRRYAVAVGIMLASQTLPVILLQVLTYEPNVYSQSLPVFIAVISTLGSVLTLFFFVGGISSVLLLRNWIITRQHLTLLRAETLRQEYSYLRKQINPHFLFNVLNSIGITAYDDMKLSRSLLENLITLLDFQLRDMRRECTTVGDEVMFLGSYLSLEKVRRDGFRYKIEADPDVEDEIIPTLMFIPFVENSVKYSSITTGTVNVKMKFRRSGGRLVFECSNPFDYTEESAMYQGGIGHSNVKRRLRLLFDDDFTLTCRKEGTEYNVKLEIPINSKQYEMYNCR